MEPAAHPPAGAGAAPQLPDDEQQQLEYERVWVAVARRAQFSVLPWPYQKRLTLAWLHRHVMDDLNFEYKQALTDEELTRMREITRDALIHNAERVSSEEDMKSVLRIRVTGLNFPEPNLDTLGRRVRFWYEHHLKQDKVIDSIVRAFKDRLGADLPEEVTDLVLRQMM